MKERLFQLLGIETGEESMLSLVLTQSVLLGIFYGTFDISAHSIFLSVYDEKMMARGYVISGLAGIILTGTYTWLQAKMHFRTLATTNFVFVTLITFLLWAGLVMFPGKIITFTVFVMLGPLNILAMLGFRGTTGKILTLHQEKRLYGMVDAGLILGIITGCFAIPVLLSLKFSSHNILLISTVTVLAASVIQIMIGKRFTFVVPEAPPAERKTVMSILHQNSYVRIMVIFIALSVMTAFFVQYSFMAVTRLQYPLEEDLAGFLGLFTGCIMIFILLIRLFVYTYIIKNYGLKLCLAISPVLVAACTALAIIIGMTMGYAPAQASGFIIFFVILALSRLFSKLLKDSVESPSLKVICQAVDVNIRNKVQSGINGTLNEISVLISGLLLAALGAISFIRLIHFSWVLVFIIGAWIVIAFRLYREYRKSIKNSLGGIDVNESDSGKSERLEGLKSRSAGSAIFRKNYFKLLSGDMSVLELSDNTWLLRQLADHAEASQDLSMLPALKTIAASEKTDEAIRHRAAEVIDQLSETKGDPGRLKKSILASTDEKLMNARRILAETRLPQTTEILRLLRHNNIESKRLAIFIIGKFRLEDMISEVCDCLKVKGLASDSENVLETFGKKAYESLFRLYLGSSGSTEISRSIIRLIGRSCTRQNTDFLFTRLWANTRILRETAADLLVKCRYKPDNNENDKLHQFVSDIIGMITWNISAQAALSKTGNSLLSGIMARETASRYTFLYNVLSIAYDKSSIDKIRVNLENGTLGSVNYAREMIDIVIGDTIKERLISLVDVVPDEEKLKNLHQFYPGEIQSYERVIDDILNRDYNLISIWAKACALHSLEKILTGEIEESVTALLFSPEKVLREEAARLIGRSDTEIFESVSSRIPAENLSLLGMTVKKKLPDSSFIFEKTNLLRSFFSEIPEDELVYLAGSVKADPDIDTLCIGDEEESLMWYGDSVDSVNGVLILNSKNLKRARELTAIGQRSAYTLNLKEVEEFQSIFPERSFGIYKRIEMLENESK